MGATMLIAEILIGGIQAGVAILLWAIALLGYGVLHKPLFLFDMHGGSWRWTPIFGIIMLAACYTLGILVDRISMSVFFWFDRFVLRTVCPEGSKVRQMVRRAIDEEKVFVRMLSEESKLSEHMQDFRSRQRIARATIFNLVLISAAFCWPGSHLEALLPRSPRSLIFVRILGAILIGLVSLAWVILHLTYEEKLKQAQEIRSGRK